MLNNDGTFSCADSPINVNPTSLYNEAEPYYSYFGKFNSPEVGPMILKAPDLIGSSGLIIEENNQNSFSRNGIMYSLIDCRLYAPGLHNVLGKKGVAELCMFFQNINSSTPNMCICVPIYVDEDRGALYFSQLRQSYDPTISNRQTLGSLFEFGSSDAIEYVSYDYRKRQSDGRTPVYNCTVSKFLTTYTVLKKAIYIKDDDYKNLIKIFKKALLPPESLNEIKTNTVFVKKFIRLCKDIQFTYKDGKEKKKPALKCYNVDPTKDIGPDGTIDLSKATGNQTSINEAVNSITTDLSQNVQTGLSMSSIEIIVSIIIAVIVSLIVLSLIGYGIFKYFSTSSGSVGKGITFAIRK